MNRERLPFVALFGFAALVRLFGLNWDQHHFFHPDERAIASAVERLSFSPLQLNPHFFAYGSFPFYVIRAVTSLLRFVHPWFGHYDGIILTGRALSAVWGAATVVLLAVLGTRLYGRRAGLLAGYLLAAAVLHVQSSHFAISDVPLTFLVLLALSFLVEAVRFGRLRDFLAGGLSIGLATATKFSALPILLPLALAVLFRWRTERRLRPFTYGLAAAALAAIGFFLGQPYAILDFRAYFHDILEQSRMVRSAGIFPYTNQYIGTPKYLYDVGQMILWGMGPLLGVAAVWGTLRCIGRGIRRIAPPEWLLLSWVVPFFLITGSFDVKFLRYLLPIYPFLILWGALWLDRLWVRRGVARTVTVAVAAGTFAWLLAFLSIYTRPHTVVTASEWFYGHVPDGTKVVTQHWDEGFPFPLPDRSPDRYRIRDLPYYEQDTPKKIHDISRDLAAAEYAVLQTKRIYGAVTRAPGKFPLTSRYFYLLFAGDLGYTLVEDFASRPALFGIQIPTELADESFSVYDHPKVLIFRNTGHLPAAEIERRVRDVTPSRPLKRRDLLLASAQPSKASERVGGQARPSGSPAPSRLATGTPAPLRADRGGSVGSAFLWLAALLLVGGATLPLSHCLFPHLQDRGAGFARTLGLAVGSYFLALSVKLGVLRNGSRAAWVSLFVVGLVSAVCFVFKRRELIGFWRERWRVIATGEAVFLAGFLLFLAFRAFNPEIFWGEKPMDFSILNILVRSETLPPSDPWFAGAPLGYYVFGQQMVAFLTLLTGVSTRFAFNLAFGLLGGTIAQGAYSLARSWAGTLRAGLAGAGFTVLLGNLAGLREWLVNKRPLDWHYFWATSRVIPDTINEYPIWSLLFADLHAHLLALPLFLLVAASALEFLRTHADPSAETQRRLIASLALGFSIAVQALTNAWDVPLLTGLLVLIGFLVALSGSGSAWTSLKRAATSAIAAGASALAFVLPLWVRGGKHPGFGWNAERSARGIDVMTHFGFWIVLAMIWWASSVSAELARKGAGRAARAAPYGAVVLVLAAGLVSANVLCVLGILLFLYALVRIVETPEERLACGFLAVAFFLVLFPQKAYLYDRMNTFFKLYFEAWPLFALSTAVLVFGSPRRSGAFDRWPLALRGVFWVLLAAAAFTSVTAVRGALFAPGNPARPGGAGRMSLDGLRYLERWRPGEYRAVEWLRRAIPGTPVILEAQGSSYQDFSRISMLTGIPTVLGWEHHVKQRGNPESEVATRRGHIQQIFSNPGLEGIPELLRRYHVGYVYVGPLERQTYPAAGLEKFDTATDLFKVAYENPDVRIYRVVGGDSQDVIAPVRETIPVAAEKPREAEEPESRPTIAETPQTGAGPFSGMREPRDAAVDDLGRIWVMDFGNSRLRIFSPEGGLLGGWGGKGSGTFNLKEPCGVAIRGEEVYVADTWNGRIQSFTIAGEWKASASDLFGPRGIAVAADGTVWVTDTGNKRIALYDRDLKPIRTIGKLGGGHLEFSDPVGIAVGPSGSIYVADAGNARIQVLDGKGEFVRVIPVAGWSRNVEPHLEVDDDETIYASDPAGDALLVLQPTGEIKERRATDDVGQKFSRPTGVAIDRKRRILFVVNSGSSSVAKVSLPKSGGNDK